MILKYIFVAIQVCNHELHADEHACCKPYYILCNATARQHQNAFVTLTNPNRMRTFITNLTFAAIRRWRATDRVRVQV